MAKKKTKVADRKKAQKHTKTRRQTAKPASGGSGGGATLGGMRTGFQSLVGQRKKKTSGAGDAASFRNVVIIVALVLVIAVLLGRLAC